MLYAWAFSLVKSALPQVAEIFSALDDKQPYLLYGVPGINLHTASHNTNEHQSITIIGNT
jgi:hypothetical protein